MNRLNQSSGAFVGGELPHLLDVAVTSLNAGRKAPGKGHDLRSGECTPRVPNVGSKQFLVEEENLAEIGREQTDGFGARNGSKQTFIHRDYQHGID
jgi:hypothetical protein